MTASSDGPWHKAVTHCNPRATVGVNSAINSDITAMWPMIRRYFSGCVRAYRSGIESNALSAAMDSSMNRAESATEESEEPFLVDPLNNSGDDRF
jgi:hypothetical protein